MFHFRASALILSALVALATAPSAHAAGTPGQQCTQAIAKTLSKGMKKSIGAHAKCYKADGTDCATNDDGLVGALADVQGGIQDKCNQAAIAEAGYGGYALGMTTAHVEFAKYFKEVATSRAQYITNETFGVGGAAFTAADDDGKKCIQTAAKEAGKYYSAALKSLGKCVIDGCSFDFSTGPVFDAYTKALAKLNGKTDCNFPALIGETTASFLGHVTRQIPLTIQSPCDPVDTSRCSFPFPNDYFTIANEDELVTTASGRRVNFGAKSLAANNVDVFVNPARWNETDGWSVGPMLLLSDPNIDLVMSDAPPLTDLARSLEADSPVVMINADTCEEQMLWIERDVRGATAADQPLTIRPAHVLDDATRYIIALRNMKNSAGATLEPSDAFEALRDNEQSLLLPVEARRPHMEEVLDTLTDCGITRSELYLAWDFTTQSSDSVTSRMLAMRDDALDLLGVNAPAFTVTETLVDPSPGIARKVTGTFQVPLYLTGTAPGTPLRTDANLVPYNNGDFYTAGFQCLVPSSASAATPARISTYGHGLLGNFTEVNASNVRNMSSEHNIVFCATFWTGFSTNDQVTAFSVILDFSNFATFIDHQHQGILNQIFLAKLLKHPNGLASHPSFQDLSSQSVLDLSDIFYDGNSQGGILGGVLAAFETQITRFSLGVPGINYSTLLNRSVDFESPFYENLELSYPTSTDRLFLLSLAQNIWDRMDPNAHVKHTMADTYPGTPAKKALYSVAFGDHQVAPVTVEIAARSNGMYIHTPTMPPGRVSEVTPYLGIPAIPYDINDEFDGSAMVIWDAGNEEPPHANIPPEELTDLSGLSPCVSSTGDPHSCPRSNVNNRIMKSEFLKTTGKIVDVCDGFCVTP